MEEADREAEDEGTRKCRSVFASGSSHFSTVRVRLQLSPYLLGQGIA
jgi:hypothetical protein